MGVARGTAAISVISANKFANFLAEQGNEFLRLCPSIVFKATKAMAMQMHTQMQMQMRVHCYANASANANTNA